MLQCYNVLTNNEIEMVHEASLEVLGTTGLRLNHPVALEKLADAGAKIDKTKEQVRLPAAVVEKALQETPKQFVCAGRTSEYDVHVSSGSAAAPVVRSAGGTISHYDFFDNVMRPITLAD